MNSGKKQILIITIAITFLLLATARFGITTIDPTGFVEATENKVPHSTTKEITIPNINHLPLSPRKLTEEDPPFQAKSALIFDLESRITLESKNEFTKRKIASITKLMTVFVSKKYIEDETDITVPRHIEQVIGSNMDLKPGEILRYNDLVKGMLIASANDAAVTVENYLSVSQGINLVNEMNKVASEIGMSSTQFDNPVGFDSPKNYSSAHDLKKLVIIALGDKDIKDIAETEKIVVRGNNRYHYLKNTNKLLSTDPRVNGLKTGTTKEAGESLIVTADFNNHTIVIILLDSPDRFEEAENLISWLIENYNLE